MSKAERSGGRVALGLLLVALASPCLAGGPASGRGSRGSDFVIGFPLALTPGKTENKVPPGSTLMELRNPRSPTFKTNEGALPLFKKSRVIGSKLAVIVLGYFPLSGCHEETSNPTDR